MNRSPIKHANNKPRVLRGQYNTPSIRRESTLLPDKKNNIKNSLDPISRKKMLRKKLKNKFSLFSKPAQKQKMETERETPSFPMSVEKAESIFGDSFSEIDRQSIHNCKVIHYYSSAKPLAKSSHIAFRFEVLALIGAGNFGKVFKCMDHKYNELVAVKTLKASTKVLEQGKVEVKIMKTLNSSDPDDSKHIVRMKKSLTFNGKICLVLELLDLNLYTMLKLGNFRGLNVNLIKIIAKQLLEALEYTKSHEVIHCDLKPENILMQGACNLKLIDFGTGCFAGHQIYTYIQSRYYRAPEILFGIDYTSAIDMWSFGCVIFELYTGRPLFPGSDETEQLMMMMQAIGYPPDELIDKGTRSFVFFNDETDMEIMSSRNLLRELDKDVELTDLIVRCLVWTPELRLTPKQGLQHPWVCF